MMHHCRHHIAAIALASTAGLTCLAAGAQNVRAQSRFDLTVENIMRGPEHYGDPPSAVRWSDDGRWIFFRWKPGGQPWHAQSALYRVAAAGGVPEKLGTAQADSAGILITAGDMSRDRKWRAVSYDGDLYLIDRATLAVRQLTDTRATERSPVFAENGGALFYLADDNIYRRELQSGDVRQLTDVRAGPAPQDPAAARGQRGFLEQQQRTLFEHIRIEDAQRRQNDSLQQQRRARDPLKTVYLERNERITSMDVERGARYAIISTTRGGATDARAVPIPFWITRSGYTEPRDMRTKVGDAIAPTGRMGIVSLTSGEVRWLDVARNNAAQDTTPLGFTRFLGWNDAGTIGLIGAGNANFKDGWLWSIDAATGAIKLIAHDRDTAWVGGPCAFWQNNACVGFHPDGRNIYFVSERDGHAHLYFAPLDGGQPRQITRGPWEISNIRLSTAADRFYLTSNEGSAADVHFYELSLDGAKKTQLTQAAGRQDATPSPDGSTLAIVHSTANRPPELFVAPARAGAQMRKVTTSPTAEWLAGPWITPEVIQIPARDGTPVPTRIYKPAEFGAQPNGAAVIFVHGAGYLQNAHHWWSDYSREYMFHHLLATRGYVVLDLDYRGSPGYGRDWRTAIYRRMGGTDLTDQVDASAWLKRTYNIDPERVGIYGGSYGGFITLMALFTQPKSFGAGAALRSVTDWAHYNHGYTGAILNLPQNDSAAYRQSSPIYFAQGLEDPLLMAHGMVDTNVHYSDIVRLTQRFIELGKTNWELASYPVEDHSFVEPASWTDEYRRILKLFERTINPTGKPDSIK